MNPLVSFIDDNIEQISFVASEHSIIRMTVLATIAVDAAEIDLGEVLAGYRSRNQARHYSITLIFRIYISLDRVAVVQPVNNHGKRCDTDE